MNKHLRVPVNSFHGVDIFTLNIGKYDFSNLELIFADYILRCSNDKEYVFTIISIYGMTLKRNGSTNCG